jgi:hypothetical protein
MESGGHHGYEKTLGVDYTSSVRVEIPKEQRLRRDELLARLSSHVLKRADVNSPIIATIRGDGNRTLRTELAFTLHPSEQYGTPLAAQNEALAREVAAAEGWRVQPEEMPTLRIPLGRRREYDTGNDVVPMSEVRRRLRDRGRSALRLIQADLVSIRYIPGKNTPEDKRVRVYHEPGVVIDATGHDVASGALEDILDVAWEADQDMIVPALTGIRTQVFRKPRQKRDQ